MRASALHEAGTLFIRENCSNVFNTDSRSALLAEMATCVPALKQFVAKCYCARAADTRFRMDSGESRTIACFRGVQLKEAPWN